MSRICWVSNTYRSHDNEKLPKEEIERRQGQIKYYQWVYKKSYKHREMAFLNKIFMFKGFIYTFISSGFIFPSKNYMEKC